MIKTLRITKEIKVAIEKHLEKNQITFSAYVKDLIKKDLKIK